MKFTKLLTAAMILATMTACVTGTRSINLELPKATASTQDLGAVYISGINDLRAFEAKPKIPEIPSVKGGPEKKTAAELSTYVGRQRNGYGGAMGSVALEEGKSVQSEVKGLLQAGLKANGYQIADTPQQNGKNLNVDIQQFWAWMVPGFVSVGFESRVALKLSVDGSQQSTEIEGFGNNEGQVASNANWELTYKRAYEDILTKYGDALKELGL